MSARVAINDRLGVLSRSIANTKKRRAPVALHPAFVAIVTVWGAALLGLSVLVLSPGAIAHIVAVTGATGLGAGAGKVFAGMSALAGAGIAFVVSRELHRKTASKLRGNTVIPALASFEWHEGTILNAPIEPIDPKQELGSESLDEPLPDKPTEHEPAPATEMETGETAAGTHEPSDAPRAYDLADFGALPGRIGPWVYEPVTVAVTETPIGTSAREETAANEAAEDEGAPADAAIAEPIATGPIPKGPRRALEQLRGTPTGELSLLQMVERFAAALHAHQDADRGAPNDAALAEALRALELFTRAGFDSAMPDDGRFASSGSTGRHLEEALARLQELRGAA